jgi:hypothetical protein
VTEKFREDPVALSMLSSAGLLRLDNRKEFYDDFANPAVITV